MQCLGADTVVLYFRHRLAPAKRDAVDHHIDGCATCRQLVARLAATSLARLPSDAGQTAPWQNELLARGDLVGRYVIEQRIGHGAMGVVYRAHDPELRRLVALKLVRGRADATPALQDRLLREAQSLAALSHPNVVPIYDAGLHGTSVFIAMEHVDGESLRRHLERTRPPVAETLRLFAAAGAGLVAAHAADLVHRDFKPDNVLVASGRVLVTDFGLAARVGDESSKQPSSDGDLGSERLTRSGMLVGTPAYMAPEQLEGRAATAASDQFAFCVALVEALGGRRPFEAATVGTLLQQIEEGPGDEALARVPRRLRSAIRRGLDRRPEARHPAMRALLLAMSQPPRQRPLLLVGAAAVGGAILVSASPGETVCEPLTGAAWNDVTREAVRSAFTATGVGFADDAFVRVDARLRSYAEDWSNVASSHCNARSQAAVCLQAQRAQVDAVIALLADADSGVVEHALEIVARLPAPSDCERTPAASVDAEAETLLARVATAFDAGRVEHATALGDEALARARASGDGVLVARALYERGRAIAESGRSREGADDLSDAHWTAVRADAWDVAADAALRLVYVLGVETTDHAAALSWARHAEAAFQRLGGDAGREAQLANNLAGIDSARADYEAARAGYERAQALWIRAHGELDPKVALASANLGVALNRLGRHDEAIAAHERALEVYEATVGAPHPDYGRALMGLGNVHTRKLDFAAARAYYERALDVLEPSLGTDAGSVGRGHANLANALMSLGELEDAVVHFDRAREIYEAAYGGDHPAIASVLIGLSGVEQSRGRFEEAAAYLQQASGITERVHGPSHPEVGIIAYNLSGTAFLSGDLDEARRQIEKAIAIWTPALGPRHPHVALAHEDLANILNVLGQFELALPAAAVAAGIHGGRIDDPAMRRVLAARGEAYLGLGRLDEAEADLRSALALATTPIERAPIAFALARVLWARGGRHREARQLARSARDDFGVAGPTVAAMLREVEAWLDTHAGSH